MEPFIGDDFLLSNDTARKLWHEYAADAPIVDYHCHVDPKEIFTDRHFDNLTQVWLGADHYKWRIMRSCGVEERYITGDAPDREKFQKFAECLPRAIGNPMVHWCHLELKNYFGYDGFLNEKTAQDVWDLTGERLRAGLSVRKMILQSNVRFIGTTDDPSDSPEWHEKLARDNTFPVTVAPTFRPDKILNIHKIGWNDSVKRLETVHGTSIETLCDLKTALSDRLSCFEQHGCRSADHGADYAVYREISDTDADRIFRKARLGKSVTPEEAEGFQTNLMLFCAEEYARRDIVMQIHYNCLRNPNRAAFSHLGADTGFDCVGQGSSLPLARLLDRLEQSGNLPKTVLYSLDAGDDAFLDSLIGAFPGEGIRNKVQHGAAWWFNDHKEGIQKHLTSLANLSVLGNFIGMLTDSRSFLGYARHEYFRRILCDWIGRRVENGEYPNDPTVLSALIYDICCQNAVRYFGLEENRT